MRLLLFTDTLGDINGVCRFLRDMNEQAVRAGRSLDIITSTRRDVPADPAVHNFAPLLARRIPRYPDLDVTAPPVLAMLKLAERIKPDVVHISTPGPVGFVGLMAARLLGVPMLTTHHTNFPAYVEHLFGSPTLARLTRLAMRLFYCRMAGVCARSERLVDDIAAMGVDHGRVHVIQPGVALERFNPGHRDPSIWDEYPSITPDSVKVLYVGRVSVEKNLSLLVRIWPEVRRACRERSVQLVIVGDGPYRREMERALPDACFLGFRHGRELSALYASADLFVFPSMTDTLGQVVLEAQASGLPAVVSNRGGPARIVDDGVSGFVLPGDRHDLWRDAIARLALEDDLRQRMGESAGSWAARFPIQTCFDTFWSIHERVLSQLDSD
jgi:glycosyltransferase involved in cell wall biosynthesis